MRRKSLPIVILIVVATGLAGLAATPARAASSAGGERNGPRVCTWGGNALAPTGTFSIAPGLTNLPSPQALAFHATGALGGDCKGTLTYDGQMDAGATCTANTFQGAARGLPGVTRFAGVGVTVLGPARLYDRAGDVVGSENADVATPENAPHFTDCLAPPGFRGGTFSSLIVLTGGEGL